MSKMNGRGHSESTHLLDDDTMTSYRSTADDTVSTKSLVLCCHGRSAKICCQEVDANQVHTRRWSHCHVPDHVVTVDKLARRKLIFASVLCLLFMIIEAVGGLLASSLAIATDAAHLLTDFASFMISLFSLWIASRPATKGMSFGYYRAEVIGALTSVLLIWVVTGILVFLAVERLVNKTYEIDSKIMLITAGIGVAVNIIMGVSLQIGGVPHGHSHGGGGHSHGGQSGAENGHGHSHKKEHNINVRAAFIHVLGDFIQSVGVLIAALVIYLRPDYAFIDPICTFFFSVLVLVTTFTIIRDVLNVLMEGMPKGVDFQEVQRTLGNVSGVVKVHNLRIWSLSLDKVALSSHLAISSGEDPTDVLKNALAAVRSKFDIFELTIQVEEYREEMRQCIQCQDPK